MLLLRLWNYLRGYVIIIIEGYFLEKFLNICIRRQIYLWDVVKKNVSTMQMKVSIKGFKSLKGIARKTRCRVRIKSKKGLPFLLNRYRRRKTFAAGAVICILIFGYLTSTIWDIEITGNKNIPTQTLVESLANLGLKTGIFRFGIKTEPLINGMLLSSDDLAWIGIEVVGTKVKVEVVEKVKAPVIIDLNTPCNIIAARDGLIKNLVIKAGLPVVKNGDTVKKGQLLVTGIVPNSKIPEEPPRNVHSMGSVMTRTWYEVSMPARFTEEERIRTGKEQNRYVLHFFGWQWNLFHGKISFENYDRILIEKRITIPGGFKSPIYFTDEKLYEVKAEIKSINPEEAAKIALQEAFKEVTDNLPQGAEVLKKDEKIVRLSNGSVAGNVIVEVLEDIAVQVPIDGPVR